MLRAFSGIRNKSLPICSKCIYFIEYPDKRYPIPSRCELFGEADIINGYIEYDFAEVCRIDSRKCGKEGKHHKIK